MRLAGECIQALSAQSKEMLAGQPSDEPRDWSVRVRAVKCEFC